MKIVDEPKEKKRKRGGIGREVMTEGGEERLTNEMECSYCQGSRAGW